MNLDEMILDVEADRRDDGRIRLKYVAISGGTGPELVMTEDIARQTIARLLTVVEQGR